MMIDRYRDGLSAAEVAEKEDISKGRVYELDRAIFKKSAPSSGNGYIIQKSLILKAFLMVKFMLE